MEDLSRLRQQIKGLIKKRYGLEQGNLRIKSMIKGTVIQHYKKCGSKSCACREGDLHGPYWYLSYKEGPKSVLKYIKEKELSKISDLADRYKKFQSNITKLNNINRDIIKLMGRIRQELISKEK